MASLEKKTLVVATLDFWLTDEAKLPKLVYQTKETFRFSRDKNYKFHVDISKTNSQVVNSIRPDIVGKAISILKAKGLFEMAKTKNCFVDLNIDRYYENDELNTCAPITYEFQIVFRDL